MAICWLVYMLYETSSIVDLGSGFEFELALGLLHIYILRSVSSSGLEPKTQPVAGCAPWPVALSLSVAAWLH
jgi:hypothetical protein